MTLNFTLRGLESSQDVMLSSRTFPKYFVTPLSQPHPVSFPLQGPKVVFRLQVAIFGSLHLHIRDSFCNGMK